MGVPHAACEKSTQLHDIIYEEDIIFIRFQDVLDIERLCMELLASSWLTFACELWSQNGLQANIS